MDNQDFWTLVVAAAAVVLASLSTLVDSFQGATDNLGGFRWLLIVGPLAMLALAGYGRWNERRTRDVDRAPDGGEIG